jgi:hypothetical protein
VVPASGTATARATGTGAGTSVLLGSAPAGVTIAYTVGGLTNGSTYTITRDGVAIGSATADSSGMVGFSDALPSGGSATYALITS